MAYVDRAALAARDQERMNAKILATLAPDALRKGKRRKPKRP
jgi:hypothetical protein